MTETLILPTPRFHALWPIISEIYSGNGCGAKPTTHKRWQAAHWTGASQPCRHHRRAEIIRHDLPMR